MLGRMHRSTLRRALCALPLATVALVACDGVVAPDAGTDAPLPFDAGPPVACAMDEGENRAVFSLPRGEPVPGTFFDLPWPNDVRRAADGTPDLDGFPNPRRNPFVRRYLDAMNERLDGFGTNGAVYFRFSRSMDEASLTEASVFLVDVDPDSPDVGERQPAVLYYQDCPTLFWQEHTVAIRPVYGAPLASARRYAAVVTNAVRTAEGETPARDADFEALLGTGGDATVDAARGVYGDVFDVLDAAGIARADLLSVAVFTTTDAIGETLTIRDWMVSSYPEPAVIDGSASVRAETPRMTILEGRYGPSPIFQEGEIPYAEAGGNIDLDASGTPVVHGEFEARFALTIPTSPMPESGYPIVLYAHGTGGSYRTVVNNDFAAKLATRGIAAMGVDQIHHGARNPTMTDPSLLFFNVSNPSSARDNTVQSALDVVQQRRLVPNLTFDVSLVERDGTAVRFDTANIYFMGHSQGGLNGPLFLAIDDGARAGVLSAASAIITPALIEKLEPLAIPDVLKSLLGLPGRTYQEAFEMEGFVHEHPIATIVQTWLEVSDASNYAHLIFHAPRDGFAPKSILMTEGLMDRYAPPRSIEALAGSMWVPQVNPVHAMVPGLVARGVMPVAPPVSGNLAAGTATAGLLQFPDDGHFAIFDNDTAEAQVLGFFESLVDGSPGTIPAP